MGPTSITPDGKIIGLFTSSDGHQHGFLLNDGEYQTIDFPGSIETGASTFWMRVTAAPRCNHWRGTHLLLAASEDGSVLFALSILSRLQVVEQRRLRLAPVCDAFTPPWEFFVATMAFETVTLKTSRVEGKEKTAFHEGG